MYSIVHCSCTSTNNPFSPAPAPVTEIQPVLDAENITLQV